jgi:cystathionine gamma-synthase
MGSDFQVAGNLRSTMKFVDSLKIPYLAPSFGGVESIVDQPAIMSYWYYILLNSTPLQD